MVEQKRSLDVSGSCGGHRTTKCSLSSRGAPKTVTAVRRRKKSDSPRHFVQLFPQKSFVIQSGIIPFLGHCVAFINRMCFSIHSRKAICYMGLCEARFVESSAEERQMPSRVTESPQPEATGRDTWGGRRGCPRDGGPMEDDQTRNLEGNMKNPTQIRWCQKPLSGLSLSHQIPAAHGLTW